MITPFLRNSPPLVASRRLSLAVACSVLTCSLGLLTSPAGAQTPAGMSLIDSAGKSFHMGESQPDASANDLPVHTVQFTKDCYFGQTKVTYAEWKEVRDWAVSHGYTDLPVGQIGTDATTTLGRPDTPENRLHPVTCVGWWDATKWCNAKSEMQ